MNNNSLQIKLIDGPTDKTNAFEKEGWSLTDKEQYGKVIDSTKYKYKFVAETPDGNIAGTLDLVIEVNLAFLDGILVGKEYQKQGFGSQLLQTAENFAKGKGCTKIYLETNEMGGAVDFYKKSGYDVTGTHEKHIMGKRTLIFTKFF